MICFVCKEQIQPQNGYFRTQLWNNRLMCHVRCQPKFYYDNRPDEQDPRQVQLFGDSDEASKKPA